jgi:DivIVA domain-containing protein
MPSGERDLLPLGTGFDVVRRGYDRGQVEEHLDRVEADLRILTADRDAAVAQASELARALDRTRAHVEELRAQIDRLAAPPDSMEGLSERLQRMLRLAQDEAREMRSSAEQAARRTREEADERAHRTVSEAEERAHETITNADEHARTTVHDADEQARSTGEEARREAQAMHEAAEADAAQVRTRYDAAVADNDTRRSAMEDEHSTLMESAHAEAARIRAEAETERRRLDEESRARRVQIEEDFEIAMASRRTESMRVLARSEADARTRAETQLRDAAAESHRRLSEADTEVAEIRRLRARVNNQLSALRESLGELPSLDAFPEEAHDETRPIRTAGPSSSPVLDHRPEEHGHDDGGHDDAVYGARSAAATSS